MFGISEQLKSNLDKKVSSALFLEHNLLSINIFTWKKVEVFLRQPYILSEISYQNILYEVADIIDKQYVICTTGYFLNNTVDQETINTVTFIFIQIWHCLIDYLGYQNIFWLHKMADGIDAKSFFPRKIRGNFMKDRQQKKQFYEPMV